MNTEIVKTIGKTVTRTAVKTGMKLRKYSPEIMLAGGLIAGAAALVTACIATKKADAEIKEAHQELDDIQIAIKNAETPEEKETLVQNEKKDSFKVYRSLVWKLCKTYGLSAFLGILSVGLILGSHGILKQRYVSTAIAYKSLDEAFKDYRQRVKEGVGEEKELHFFNGTEEGGEVTVIDENGDAQTTKDIVKTKEKKYTPYEFDFNAKTAPGSWEANADYNLMFLRQVENYLNDLLNSRGHVFLNEALDSLGLKRTREGAVTGWIKGNGGDDYVDLGVSDYYTDEYCESQDGYLKNIHLNFNVDGLIWDKI